MSEYRPIFAIFSVVSSATCAITIKMIPGITDPGFAGTLANAHLVMWAAAALFGAFGLVFGLASLIRD